ncbi:MAG: nitroreductase family deazaflavin-dependent oxidoreductase [Nocardioidaceae bacterium]|nr:nitroreductase family deazaflavin-dependent oxidoreductase [Nocardioidaceae bacterium]
MAYLKPRFFAAKVFNPLAMKTGIGGTETLTVVGRATGQPQRIPVIPLDHEGARYLVSTRGESQWVLNVRAHPTVTVAAKGGSREYHATEVPPAAKDAIISAYRVKAGKTVEAYWKQLPNSEDHPVFLLV